MPRLLPPTLMSSLALLPFMLVSSLAQVMEHPKRCSFYDVVRNLTVLNDPLFNDIRPVKNPNQTTIVSVDFKLYAVLDLDMKSQSLKTFGWLDIQWKNEYLSWDPEEFCNIKRITVGADAVWKPDLFLYEMTDEDKSPTIQYLYVDSDGRNHRSEPIMVVSTCGLDTYRFPFDTQTCNLTIGSFLHSASEITVKPELNSSAVTEASKRIFSSKGDWTLLRIDVESVKLDFENRKWSQIVYSITIERTPSHYVVTLIVPACLLVLIDLASMFIPIDGNERLNFKITLVLGFSVLLLILNDLLPSSQGTPIMEIFCMVCLILMITSIGEGIFIAYLLQQSSIRRVPRWIHICVLKHLANLVAVDTKAKHDEDGNDDMNITKETGLQIPALLTKKTESFEGELLKGVLVEMLKIRQGINANKNGDSGSEWYMVVFVLDRFFILLYAITVLTALFVIAFIWA